MKMYPLPRPNSVSNTQIQTTIKTSVNVFIIVFNVFFLLLIKTFEQPLTQITFLK